MVLQSVLVVQVENTVPVQGRQMLILVNLALLERILKMVVRIAPRVPQERIVLMQE